MRVENDRLFINDKEIYSEAHKPTPAEVGAVNKAGDTMTGKLYANGNIQISNSSPLLTFTETDSGNQNYIFVADGKGFRLNRGTTGVTNDTLVWRWFEGASTDDSRLELINPVSRTDQLNATNALTRKDYVDGQVNTRVPLDGGTMSGKLILNYQSSVKLPSGTTAQRSTGVTGDMRFNTDEVTFEGYDGAEWQTIGSGKVKYTIVKASLTAQKGKGYLVDTNIAGIVVTLPADARDSDYVVIGDASGKAHLNPFYIAGYNGDRVKMDRENCTLVFSKVGDGWKIVDGVGENGAIRVNDFLHSIGGALTGALNVDSQTGKLRFIRPNSGPMSAGLEYMNDDGSLGGTIGATWNGIQKTLDNFYIGTTSTANWMKVKSNGELYANGANRIYHQGFKPSITDITGAVNKAGDVMTGRLNVFGSNTDTSQVRVGSSTHKAVMSASSTAGEFIFGGTADGGHNITDYIRIGRNSLQYQTNGVASDIYHTRNKPTKTDVGLPLVENIGKTDAPDDGVNNLYATAKAVNAARNLAFVYSLIM
ncbi:MAG: hypothetical protein ACRCWQ_14745 [Bacilli bacterium]